MQTILISLGLLISIPATAASSTINVPSEQLTIQDGINNAVNGDTVLVAPGVYYENLSITEKYIVLMSTSGSEVTAIEPAQNDYPILHIYDSRDDTTGVVSGFTFRNANGAPGIFSEYSEYLIESCEIYNCNNDSSGGAFCLHVSYDRIRNNSIHDNTAVTGGGIAGTLVDLGEIAYNSIFNNGAESGSGIYLEDAYGWYPFHHNLIYDNYSLGDDTAFAISCVDGYMSIANNTIVRNPAGVKVTGDAGCHLWNNIIADNDGYAYLFDHLSSGPSYNDFWNNAVPYEGYNYGGISDDPLFVDPENHDFSLQINSLCIDQGRPDVNNLDPDSTRPDIGAIAYNHILPVAQDVNFGERSMGRTVSHTPTFYWHYHDTLSSEQAGFEIDVGSEITDFEGDLMSSGNIMSTDTFFTYSGAPLDDGMSYYFRVKLYTDYTSGDFIYKMFRMNNIPGVPNLIRPVDNSSVFAGNVTLMIDSASNIDCDTITYDFEIYSDTLVDPVAVDYGSRETFTHIINELEPGIQYWWHARSYDKYESSPWSHYEQFITRSNAAITIPDDAATIQSAVDMASSGDTIIIRDGVYTGEGNRDVLFYGKNVCLESLNGPEYVTIDCQGTNLEYHRAFNLNYNEDSSFTIDGFTIINGYHENGGAIYCKSASPLILNCAFRNNKATLGGAIYGGYPDFIIDNCVFENDSAKMGGGVYGYYQLDIRNSIFSGNLADDMGSGIYAKYDTEIKHCTFHHNNSSSIALNVYSQDCHIEQCLFYKNEIAIYTSGYSFGKQINKCTIVQNITGVNAGDDSHPELYDCLIAYNTGYACTCYNCGWDCPYNASADLYNCDLYENGHDYVGCIADDENANGNISQNPVFCDTTGSDYSLAGNSPCLGAGTDGSNIGALGIGCTSTGFNDDPELPFTYELNQNYPNPFNPGTTIEFSLETKTNVEISIFNILGQKVITLINKEMPAGAHEVYWDGIDRNGQQVSSGLYFYRITTDKFVKSKKMVVLK